MLGVLVSAGAAICLAPCDLVSRESNLGQAITAVTVTRLWALSFSLPRNGFVFMRLLYLQRDSCCAMARTLLHSPTGDAAALPAFLRAPRWPASCRFFLLVPLTSVPSAADHNPPRMVPECAALLAPVTCAGTDRLPC